MLSLKFDTIYTKWKIGGYSRLLCIILFFLHYYPGFAQSDTIHKNCLIKVIGIEATTYGASLIGLNYLWYKDYARSSFHWFDDSREWCQLDKAGHYFSAYYVSNVLTKGYKLCGMEDRKSILIGSSVGLIMTSSIEIFDGFSEQWGASYSDILANSIGMAFYAGQELIWNQQKIIPKISFHHTEYAKYRPDVLGRTGIERMLKDYNGQTYWLSFNIHSITNFDKVPPWFNVAFGYSANKMITGNENEDATVYTKGEEFQRYRQYFISFDIDFRMIHTRSKVLRNLFHGINVLKVPFPACEFYQRKCRFHPIYF